ncbi:MAG: ROK family protein [Lachnospiraceae bacterium]|jgi:glucokinase|nr:ROK family protein [uncultured Acetatifactor sp.]MCI9229828.1 ROK family protein [Lachnospiraceae bacterium]MCI9572895.1 ROK family protein [Lachnospiraceae bacterium]
MSYRIGIDIGGMSVKLGIVDDDFRVIERMRIATGMGCRCQELIADMVDACRQLGERYPVSSVGIGSAGLVDSQRGYVVRAGNLPFQNEPLAEKLSGPLGLPVYLDNDANCALIGEHMAGACQDCQDAIILTIGTGIGGAILIGGRIYRGHNGRAGEFGHFVFDRQSTRRCSCGLTGCFEEYASATALLAMTRKKIEAAPDSLLAVETAAGVDGMAVFGAAQRGCREAVEVLQEYARILAMGINSMVHIFQPEVTVLSGGISLQGDYLLGLLAPYLLPESVVRTTALEGNGGLIGAALLGTI